MLVENDINCLESTFLKFEHRQTSVNLLTYQFAKDSINTLKINLFHPFLKKMRKPFCHIYTSHERLVSVSSVLE